MIDTMRQTLAAALFVAVVASLTGCSGAVIPSPPSEEPVEEDPLENWRVCEVDWRCYAIDPETGKRTGLLRSDTAWADMYVEKRTTSRSRSSGWPTTIDAADSRACRNAQGAAERAHCREGGPYFEQLEIDRGCSCGPATEEFYADRRGGE